MLNNGQAWSPTTGFFLNRPAGLNEIVEVLETPSDAVLTSDLTPAIGGGRFLSHSHRRAALLPCHGAGILASHEQPALDTHPSIPHVGGVSMRLIAYGPLNFDVCVNEAARFLMTELEAYDWVDGHRLTQEVAKRLGISYLNSKRVVTDLLDLGMLEANYGTYRVKRRGSLSL